MAATTKLTLSRRGFCQSVDAAAATYEKSCLVEIAGRLREHVEWWRIEYTLSDYGDPGGLRLHCDLKRYRQPVLTGKLDEANDGQEN